MQRLGETQCDGGRWAGVSRFQLAQRLAADARASGELLLLNALPLTHASDRCANLGHSGDAGSRSRRRLSSRLYRLSRLAASSDADSVGLERLASQASTLRNILFLTFPDSSNPARDCWAKTTARSRSERLSQSARANRKRVQATLEESPLPASSSRSARSNRGLASNGSLRSR